MFLIKTDHELNASNAADVRYNHQNFTGEGFETGGAQNALEHTGASMVRTRSFNASWSGIVSRRPSQRAQGAVPARQEPGEANSDRPEGVVQQGGTDRVDDR